MDKLKAIAHYLLLVETIEKPDIEEIMATGKLKRVDDLKDKSLNDLGTEAKVEEPKVEEKPEETTQDETR